MTHIELVKSNSEDEVRIRNNTEQFKNIFKKYIKRDGADTFLAWLESSDFFYAPASTRYHLSVPGGLCEHSLHVYKRLLEEIEGEGFIIDAQMNETIAIVALLHDICKANFYTVELRNKKNEYGKWIQVPYYGIEDQLPYGHGEKSVYIVSAYMKLSREEAMAIRWHMGGLDETVRGGGQSQSQAFNKFRLAVLLHIADLKATFLDEV